MPRKESTTSHASAKAQQDAVSEGIDSFELPRSLVTRIARSACPDNVKLQKETVLALLKGSTVFVNYIAATAHDVAASKQHKSVSASDVLKALELTQFGDMVDQLQNELQIYRDLQKADKSKKSGGSSKGKAKEADTAPATTGAAKSKTAKGKEKATSISVPKVTIPAVGSAGVPPIYGQEPDEDGEDEIDEDEIRERGEGEGEDEEMVDGEELDEELDEGEEEVDEGDEPEDEDDEVEDTMALEEEEVRRDANRLEGGGEAMEE